MDLVNIHALATDLALVEREATEYGMSKALRDRFVACQAALHALEAAREARLGVKA